MQPLLVVDDVAYTVEGIDWLDGKPTVVKIKQNGKSVFYYNSVLSSSEYAIDFDKYLYFPQSKGACDMDIKNVQKYGHTSYNELQREIMQEKRYMEDIYEQEIETDDTYYVDEHGQLVHEKSLNKYALDHCNLIKKTR